MSSPSRESSIAEAKSLGFKYHDGEWVSPKHKALKRAKLNPAQRASKKMLGEAKHFGRKHGEAPLQHLKRLTSDSAYEKWRKEKSSSHAFRKASENLIKRQINEYKGH